MLMLLIGCLVCPASDFLLNLRYSNTLCLYPESIHLVFDTAGFRASHVQACNLHQLASGQNTRHADFLMNSQTYVKPQYVVLMLSRVVASLLILWEPLCGQLLWQSKTSSQMIKAM